ncbi:MAG: Holliday junction resolvase RuvX [Clostridia bacterium]
MGRVLALDVGDRRIGLALSDPMKIIANPYDTLFRSEIKTDLKALAALIVDKEVDTIVCGLPKNMNNEESIQTSKTREFIEQLKEYTTVKVIFIDERLTTVSAQRVLIEGNVRRDKRKNVVDKVAATLILQSYLGTI